MSLKTIERKIKPIERKPMAPVQRSLSLVGGAARKRYQKPMAFERDLPVDPLIDLKVTENNIEASTGEAMEAMRKAYTEADIASQRKQMSDYTFKRKMLTDTNYYRVLVFETYVQADQFMEAAGFDKDTMYLDGRALSEKMGIELAPPDWRPSVMKPNKRMAALAQPLPKKG